MNNHVELIPVKPDNPYPLGRAGVNHDPLNAGYRALVTPPTKAIVPNQLWYTREVFDQGQNPNCTIEACAGLLATYPFKRRLTAADWALMDTEAERFNLYKISQQYDPWAGEAYEGTSTDAPFKLLRERGVLSQWKWLFGEPEVREWLTWYGPAVMGTVWLEDMFYPDSKGYLKVSGAVAGGHAYRIVRYDNVRHAYRMVQSWGPGWGEHGRAWIRDSDLAALLNQDGDAVTVG